MSARLLVASALAAALAAPAWADPQYDLVRHSGEQPDIEKVREALKAKAKINQPYLSGDTALMAAAAFGRMDIAELLLERKANINQRKKGSSKEEKDRDGRTPLMMAIQNGHTAMARFLIERKAGVGVASEWGDTALHWAAHKGNLEITRLLLEKGAQPDALSKLKSTPFIKAAAAGHLELCKLLRDGKRKVNIGQAQADGMTALHLAANGGHLAVVEYLLELGRPVDDAPPPNKSPALMDAAWSGHLPVVERLLAAGANPNAKTAKGWTALMFAAKANRPAVLRRLIKAGAEVNAAAADGANATYIAAANGHTEALRELLRGGGRVLGSGL